MGGREERKGRKGKERKGKERKGKERKGKERKGKERKGRNTCHFGKEQDNDDLLGDWACPSPSHLPVQSLFPIPHFSLIFPTL
jgi:hypothetical protein